MLAFRSEAHVDRWLAQRRLEKGSVFTPEQMWLLAKAWYTGRMAPDWSRRPPEATQALFDELGLTGDFWRLRAA